MSSRHASIGVGGGRSGGGRSSRGGRSASGGDTPSDEERKRLVRSEGARKRVARWWTNRNLTPLSSLRAYAPSPTYSDEWSTPTEYSPSTVESEGDKVVPRDYVHSDEAEQRAFEKLRRRLELVHAAERKREEEEARYAVIQVAAYESKQKELAMRRVKQEVIELDVD